MEKEISYFNIEAWSKLAENANNFGRKGRSVRIVGRLKQERWQDNDGKTRSNIVIVAEHLEFRPEFNKDSYTMENTEEVEKHIPAF